MSLTAPQQRNPIKNQTKRWMHDSCDFALLCAVTRVSVMLNFADVQSDNMQSVLLNTNQHDIMKVRQEGDKSEMC